MRTIAFYGGGLIAELGPVSDVVLFFDCVNAFVVFDEPDIDWSLLTDRVYRRYVEMDSMAPTSDLMARAKVKFDAIASAAVVWSDSMQGDGTKTELDCNKSTLGEVFEKYFDQFELCVAATELFYRDWSISQPVRLVITEMPWFLEDKHRPLAAYEALESEAQPFWLR